MEAGLASDEVVIAGKGDTSFGNDGVEVSERVEVPVDDGFVDVGPERLGRLRFGRVGRQVNEADALGDLQGCGVPASAVEDENDDPVSPGARFPGEEREGVLEERLVDAGPETPEALAGGRRDEGGDVEPLEAVVAGRDGALAARRPDPAQDRLQPDAVLVGGKGFDRRAGMALGFPGDGLRKLFLNVACSSGVAACACCGRGR